VEAHILTFAGRGRDWAVLVGLCKHNGLMEASASGVCMRRRSGVELFFAFVHFGSLSKTQYASSVAARNARVVRVRFRVSDASFESNKAQLPHVVGLGRSSQATDCSTRFQPPSECESQAHES
jgi:hypothetical protein